MRSFISRRITRKRFSIITICVLILFCITACAGKDNSNFSPPDRGTGYQAPAQLHVGDPAINGFDLTGAIVVADNVACDGDVNDPNAPLQSNDLPETAQPITTPVTVGGFVRWPAAGSAERSSSASSWDRGDYYAATLRAGDTIQLVELDQSSNSPIHVELRMASAPDAIIAARPLNVGESIIIEESNAYLVHVYASEGSFNYLLRIGNNLPGDLIYASNSDRFVPGEAIIRFRDDGAEEANRTGLKALAAGNLLLTSAPSSDQPVLMKFKTSEQRAILHQHLNLSGSGFSKQSASGTDADPSQDETMAVIAALNQQPDVLYAEPNYIRKLSFVPNDPYYPLQWHYPLIGLEQAWDITRGSRNVVVAIVDSGVRFDHPDLAGKLTGNGYDFISSTAMSLDGDGPDADPSDPGDRMSSRSSFHGTHVAGTIAAAYNNGIGLAGVGGATRVMPVRSFGLSGEGTVMDTLQAVRYAAGMQNDSGVIVSQPADIINLSLGGAAYSAAEAELFDEIINRRNIVVVAAAGNEATEQPTYPASYPGVISVAAVDLNRQQAPYSNFGDYIDIAAPGGDLDQDANSDNWPDGVLSTLAVDDPGTEIVFDYGFYQGTSMAAPHVAGVIALMKAVRPNMTVAEVLGWLAQGDLTSDLGAEGWDPRFGYGLIDAHRAVLTARSDQTPAPGISVSPRSIDFGESLTEAGLRLDRIGAGDLALRETVCSAEWLQVRELDTDEDGFGAYSVIVNRAHQELIRPGTYEAQINFIFNSQTVTVNVTVNGGGVGDNNVGRLYVLLLDPKNRSTRYGIAAQYLGAGRYEFAFDNLPAGQYDLVAGSNRDNDDRIGEPGEALSIDARNLTLDRDISLEPAVNVDFNVASEQYTQSAKKSFLSHSRYLIHSR